MPDFEQRLRQEDTEILQEKIRTNSYRDDVAAIATQILIERKAVVPVPETESEIEDKVKANMALSTQAFFTVLVWIAVVLVFQPSVRNSIIFGLTLLPVFAYLRSRRKK